MRDIYHRSTVGLPSNPTNPIGMLVLGYMYNNSENLMLGELTSMWGVSILNSIYLDSPLATNINYTVGQVQITVPNVQTREDYIVVWKYIISDAGGNSN